MAISAASGKYFGLSGQEVICGVVFAPRPETGPQREMPITMPV